MKLFFRSSHTSRRVSKVGKLCATQVPQHQHRAVATTSPKNKVSHPSHASHLSHGDVVGSILCIISIQTRRASWNHRQMANRESGIGNRDWGRTPSAFPYSPLLAPLSYWWAEVERQEAALDRQIERKIRLLVELQRRRREPERGRKERANRHRAAAKAGGTPALPGVSTSTRAAGRARLAHEPAAAGGRKKGAKRGKI